MKSQKQKKPTSHVEINSGLLVVTSAQGNVIAMDVPTTSEDGIFISPEVVKQFKFQEYKPPQTQPQMMATGFKPFPEFQMS